MKLALKSRVTKKPGRPKNKCRGVVHDIVSSHAFNVAVVILICLNICLLCITTDGDAALQQGLGYANIAFVGVFTVEAVVKIIGLGFRGYFIMRWNQYDFFLVVVALIGLVTETILRSNNLDFVKSIATFLRVFRIARAGRLVSMFESLQHLFRTFVMFFAGFAGGKATSLTSGHFPRQLAIVLANLYHKTTCILPNEFQG